MTTIATKYPFVGSIETKQGGRGENQDNAGFVDTPLGLLLVVCDGMGGGPGGRTASLMAVDTILSVLADVAEHTRREDALNFAIEKANDIIFSKAQETPELRGMGTTVAAILINEDSAVIAHAGDTRVYQLRKGMILFRSSDHSVVANYVRQNKMTEEEARNHPQSNIVTRALGIRPNIEIELDEVTFLRGDRFVLCTDGIWGMMPQRDLVKTLSQAMGINELTFTITESIDKIGQANGGGHDNLTLAIIDTSFDSVIKKIQKKSHSGILSGIDRKSIMCVHKARNIWILLFFIVVCFLFICWFFLTRQKEGRAQERNLSRGITTTTVNNRTIKTTKRIVDENTDSSIIDNHIIIQPGKTERGPFHNADNITEQYNREISNQIDNVVKNLDNLKGIKGKTQKRKYIEEIITPDVNSLGGKLIDNKKHEIKEILKLLHDKATISSDWRGHTTSEGNKHIEYIKIKVNGLRE